MENSDVPPESLSLSGHSLPQNRTALQVPVGMSGGLGVTVTFGVRNAEHSAMLPAICAVKSCPAPNARTS